jgi:CxxC motif-containing protein
MTNKKEITCIVCPLGCRIIVDTNGKIFKVLNGNKCIKGIEYARAEALNPKRMLTSSVLVKNGEWPLVSVKSALPVPKESIFQVLEEIKNTTVNAPVKIGQVLIKNSANTKINIIATKSVKKL